MSRDRSLCTFVLDTLLSSSVVTDKVRPNANQWRGYLMLLKQTTPFSFKHLLSMPATLTRAVLTELPKEFSLRLNAFLSSDQCDLRVSQDILRTVKVFAESHNNNSSTTANV